MSKNSENITTANEISDNSLFGESEDLDYLEVYLEELDALPDYTEDEITETTIRAMEKDEEAVAALINMHLREVVDIARLYTGQGVYIEDLIGEGNVALSIGVTQLDTIKHHSEASGMLTRMIMDAMEEHIRETNDKSDADEKLLRKVNRVYDKAKELAEAYGRKVTVDELVNDAGLSRKAVNDAIALSGGLDYISGD